MKKFLISVFCLAVTTLSALSWEEDGHRAIVRAAMPRLNAVARKAINRIMAGSRVAQLQSMESAAIWPDLIRQTQESAHNGTLLIIGNPEAIDFNTRFPGNYSWHFSSFPLGGKYSNTGPFSASNDLPHMIVKCIDILEGAGAPEFANFRQDEALAWLIHLVGDAHQPLHVSEGFYINTRDGMLLISDRILPQTDMSMIITDQYANLLYYTETEEFHGFWDKEMVNSISPQTAQVVAVIETTISAMPNLANSNDYHKWAIDWVNDSILVAKDAYKPLTHGDFNRIGKYDTFLKRITTQLDTKEYKADFAPVVRQQLAKASFNLADLLNHINWR